MIFQAIDDKSECIGVYANGKLHFEDFPANLTKTWKYSGSIKGSEGLPAPHFVLEDR